MYNMLSWLGRRTRLSGTTRLRLSTPTGDLKVEKVRIFLKSPVVYCIVSIVWKKSWRMDNSKYKISHPPPRHSFGPEFWNVAPPFIGCLFTGQVRCTHVCPTWHLAPFIGSVYLNEIKQPSSQIELNQLNYLFPKTYLVHDSLNHCWHIVVTRLLTEVSHNSKVIKSFATISHPTITPSKWSRSIFDIEEDQWIMIIS